ncbi:MAG: 23S rRNA (guanosine(2251)-2'-O)-methyltransferase RlmB [Candidatus Limnocylindrales bacterium]
MPRDRGFVPRERPQGRPGGVDRYGRPGAQRDPGFGSSMPSPAALAEGEELVAGRRPVEEAFVARRPAHRLLVVPQRRAALEKIVLHATNLRIPIVEVEGGSLTALAGFDGHQGVALVVEPRRYAGIDDVLARAAERGEPPFVLVLDSLEDPHNVGSLLRSAEAAGVHGVLFPTTRQAPMSPSAVKASAGAVEHLLLCPVDDLAGALTDLKSRGLRVAGADGSAPMTARQTDLRGPLVIVVGSEGQGLGPAVRRRCDLFMRIPMRGSVGSLNAAVAGSILLFEAVAQRDTGAGPAPIPTGTFDDLVAARVATEAAAEAAPATTEADVAEEGDAPAIDAPVLATTTDAATPKPKARRANARQGTTPAAVLAEPVVAAQADTPPAEVPAAKAPRAPRKPRAAAPRTPATAGDDDLLPADGAQASIAKPVRKRATRKSPPAPTEDQAEE